MKDPEKREFLACLRNSSDVGMAEIEQARKRAVGNAVERWDHVGLFKDFGFYSEGDGASV